MIKFGNVNMKIIEFSSATTTAGTNVAVAHGLSHTPHARACFVQGYSDSVSTTDDAQAWNIASTDGTNVNVRPSRTLGIASKGRIYIIMDGAEGHSYSPV